MTRMNLLTLIAGIAGAVAALATLSTDADEVPRYSDPPSVMRTISLEGDTAPEAVTVEKTETLKWYGGPGMDGRQMIIDEAVWHDIEYEGLDLGILIAVLPDPQTAERLLVGTSQLGAAGLDAGTWAADSCPGNSCWTAPDTLAFRADSVCYLVSCAKLRLQDGDPLLDDAHHTMLSLAETLVRRQAALGVPSAIGSSPWTGSQVERRQLPPEYAAVMIGERGLGDLVGDGIAYMSWANGLVLDTDAVRDPAYVEELVVPAEPATGFSVIYRRFSSPEMARVGADAARDFLDHTLEEVTPDSRWSNTARKIIGDGDVLCPGEYCLASWRPPALTYVIQTGDLCSIIVSTQADGRTALSRTLALAHAIVVRQRGATAQRTRE